MRSLALSKRAEHGVQTTSLNLTVMRRVYRREGITIDRWDLQGRKIKASYFCDGGDCSVLVNKNLPREPKLFALAHELKHHYVDQEILRDGRIRCGDYNRHEFIEKTAEVFGAEFIYPEDEMRELATHLGVTPRTCSKERIVEFKRACPACVSYTFVVKRFEWFGFCPRGTYDDVHFQKLEEELYGLPIYKQEWFKKQRAQKKRSS
ncbi:MAG: hypothetical protein AUG51_21650 [Acidobacteria bacterium 13_1_20CM_3_53_8]|nr:MAG: hypothetical protein AUG51_21650 [Acidobacteria bacterium 13_1_20CM_3_53_8]